MQTTNHTAPTMQHVNDSFISRYKTALYNLASDAMAEDVSGNEQAAQLQSIIAMTHTLVMEDRLEELDNAIREAFPEYYLEQSA